MDKKKKKIFIGVAWPYVNGNIHIGHFAGYLLPADIFARFNRFIGNDVLMVSGSDCFGTPITIEADERNMNPQEVVEEYHIKAVRLFKKLGITYDCYTKTDTENHIALSQQFFLTLLEKGYIFKDKTNQYYSEANNRFLPDRYVVGECPNCKFQDARSDQCDECGRVLESGELKNPKSKFNGDIVQLKETEHYFLDWKKLSPFLSGYVKKHSGKWRGWVRKETEGWLKQGLKPRAITRDLDWGVPLPEDAISDDNKIDNIQNKRLYVWFEAVIGYLSASLEWAEGSKKWKEWWYGEDSEHYYFMGKDNLIFHTLFWPGQLYAYDSELHLPDVLSINQFLQLEGKQFSKSRGVVLDLREMNEEYGADPLRFYLASIMPETSDSNFSWDGFANTHNNILIAKIGNFINRTLSLADDCLFDVRSPDRNIRHTVRDAMKDSRKFIENNEFKKYVEEFVKLADFGNKYLSVKKPWEEVDHSTVRFYEAVINCSYIVLGLLIVMKPLLPTTYDRLAKMIGVSFRNWPSEDELEEVFKNLKIGTVFPLFQKIDI